MNTNYGLVFVYNADNGFFNLIADISHKILSPSTYPCNLCALTHGTFNMRKEWKDFLHKIKAPLTFLHRDEFRKQNDPNIQLPAIFLKDLRSGALIPFIDTTALKSLTGIEDLKKLLNEKMTFEDLL